MLQSRSQIDNMRSQQKNARCSVFKNSECRPKSPEDMKLIGEILVVKGNNCPIEQYSARINHPNFSGTMYFDQKDFETWKTYTDAKKTEPPSMAKRIVDFSPHKNHCSVEKYQWWM